MSYAFHRTHKTRRPWLGVRRCRRCSATAREAVVTRPCPER